MAEILHYGICESVETGRPPGCMPLECHRSTDSKTTREGKAFQETEAPKTKQLRDHNFSYHIIREPGSAIPKQRRQRSGSKGTEGPVRT